MRGLLAAFAWAAMFGHMSDVGGKVPGSLPTDATSIHEEGVVVPPVKIVAKGTFDTQLVATILKHDPWPQHEPPHAACLPCDAGAGSLGRAVVSP